MHRSLITKWGTWNFSRLPSLSGSEQLSQKCAMQAGSTARSFGQRAVCGLLGRQVQSYHAGHHSSRVSQCCSLAKTADMSCSHPPCL